MNETNLRLDDLLLFRTVADSGGLSAAAKRLDIPLPTLSRRMNHMERQTGKPLFLRGKAGYALTAEGRALADELSGLHDLRHRVARWQNASLGPSPVRITAGYWTSRHLARQLPPDPEAEWRPAFVPSDATLDLARREADIGLRNSPPDHPWLARHRLRHIDYAVYGPKDVGPGFVTLSDNASLPRSQVWVQDKYGRALSATASDIRVCLDLCLQGFGRMVLPCFAGDTEPKLDRLSDPIPELAHDEWLVSHHEARHDPPIRAALDAIRSALIGDD